jgi:ABC-type antimicrobial peptide transport system permease subunit
VLAGIATALGVEAAGLGAGRVTWLPFALSLAACVVIGVVGGVLPARRAARLDPVAALHSRAA